MLRLKNYPLFNFLILLSGLLFIALYLVLSYNNRFAADDYMYIYDVNHYGIIGAMLKSYREWSGRWISCLLAGLVYYFNDFKYTLFVYGVFLISFFLLSVLTFLRNLLRTVDIQISKLLLTSYTLLISLFLFLTTFNIAEVWFWSGATASYFCSVIFMFLGAGLIFNQERLSSVLIFFSFLFIGGASEFYSTTLILILLFLLIYESKYRINLLTGLCGLLISFLITSLAPANPERLKCLPDITFINAIVLTFKSLFHLIKYDLLPKILYYIIISVVFIKAGSLYKDKIIIKNHSTLFLKSIVFLFFLVFYNLYMSAYLLGDFMPGRATFQISIFIISFIIFWSFIIGSRMKLSPKISDITSTIVLVILIITISTELYKQSIISNDYSKAVDRRLSILEQYNKEKQKEAVTLPSLPSSGMLYSSEISKDTCCYRNCYTRKALGLGFNIKIEN